MAARDPRLRQVSTPPAGPEVQKLFKDHKEAIVIIADPDGDGEANLAVFTKLANKEGVLAAYLEQVLRNLLKTNGKQHRAGKVAPTGA